MPVCSTNRIGCRHRRSSIGRGPGDRVGHGGSTGAISSHNPSSSVALVTLGALLLAVAALVAPGVAFLAVAAP